MSLDNTPDYKINQLTDELANCRNEVAFLKSENKNLIDAVTSINKKV